MKIHSRTHPGLSVSPGQFKYQQFWEMPFEDKRVM